MKRKSIIFIIGLSLLSFVSCNDWLDLYPANKIIDEKNAIKSLDEANYKLNAAYTLFRSYYSYGARMTYYGDALSEDMMAQSGTKRVGNYYTFRFDKDNAPSSFWSNYYEIINNVNILIRGIDNVPATTASEIKIKNDYKGQALTVRALAYFDLTRLYGYPYMKDEGASLGVPIVDENTDADYKPKRNTVAECYEYIIDDLTEAVSLIGDAKSNGKFNKWGAMQILSRVYLYKGDDNMAFQTAKEAIQGAEKKGYKLWTADEYLNNAWVDDFGSESVWEIPVTSTENMGNDVIGYLVYAAGYDDILISDDWLVQLMGNEKDDIRYKSVMSDGGKGSKSGTRYLWKYQPQSGETNRAYGNIRVLRLSELYLIAAEAAARKGNANDDAIKYLEPIVKRADPNKSLEGTTVTLDRVLEERRKELLGEGHRFFDAIRNGKKISRSKDLNFPHLPLIVADAWEFDWDYYKIVLPIPKSEIDANINIRDQQNPKY